jgi:uncharacterized membrane protein YkvA (DUF1232 family)
MGYVYSDQQLKDALKALKKIKGVRKTKNFDQLDYQMIVEALERSPMHKYISQSSEGLSVLQNDDDDGEMSLKPSKIENRNIPEFLLPIIDYSTSHSSFDDSTDKRNRISSTIDAFLRSVLEYLSRGKSLYVEIEKILKQADNHYQHLRHLVHDLDVEYENHFLEALLILPDLFVYLCRLLASKEVDERFKIKLVLAIIYIVSPIDVVPEAIMHAFGLFDDIIVAISTIFEGFSTNVISRDSMRALWPGDPDDVEKLNDYYGAAREMLGEELDNIIRHVLRKRSDDVRV